MNFDRFEKCLFYQSGRTRLNPVTLTSFIPDKPPAVCVFDCSPPINDMTDSDDMNLHFFNQNDWLQYLYLSFDQSIRYKVSSLHTGNDKEWIPDEFKTVLLSQRQEVTDTINFIRKTNNFTRIHRHRCVITPPGFTVHSHYHYFSGSTITIGYILNSDDQQEKSFLLMTNNKIPVEIPQTEKFFFHFRNDPRHGAKVNHWICWYYTDFETPVTVPELPITELKSQYFDGNISV